MTHEGFEAADIMKLLALVLGVTQIGQQDAHAGIQEGEFAQPVLDRRIVEFDGRERLGRRQEGDGRAALRLAVLDRRIAHTLQRADDVSISELDEILAAVTPYPQFQP